MAGVPGAEAEVANEEDLRPSVCGTSGSFVQAMDVFRRSCSALFRGVDTADGGAEVIQMKKGAVV
jgi:hypothetical protein